MKHLVKHILRAIVAAVLLCACNPQPQAPKLLKQAQALIDEQPDSAMRLIDSIFYPEKSLGERERMQYWITRVQVRRKLHKPIADDTLIFAARDYFSNQKNTKEAVLASFYSGCVYFEQKNYSEAMQNYKAAEQFALKTGDADLQGLVQYNIGDLLAEQDSYTEALEAYRLAENRYAQSPKKSDEKRAQCLSAAGRMFLLAGKTDSALVYFHNGLELAENAANNTLQSLLTQNLSVVYMEAEQYQQAETYLRKSFSLNADTAKLPRYYLNLIDLYLSINQTDSAAVYASKLKQTVSASDDLYFKASAYNFLAEYEKRLQNFDAAFEFQKWRMNVVEKIMEKQREQSVYEVQQKYDFERIQNQHTQELVYRQWWIIGLLLAGIAITALFIAYIRKKRKQSLDIKENLNTIREMNRDLEAMVEQKNTDLRKELLWRFDVAKKVMALNEITKEKADTSPKTNLPLSQFNQIVYGITDIEEQWEALFSIFNNACPGYAEKIKENFPALTENEFRICVLTYAGFRVKEISIILKQSHNTIQTRRTDVRKKIGIVQSDHFADFLDKKLGYSVR